MYDCLSENEINTLIYSLRKLAKEKGYTLTENGEPSIQPTSIIKLLTRQDIEVPDKFKDYLIGQGTPYKAWENIDTAPIAYKSILALALYDVSINVVDNSYDKFALAILEKYVYLSPVILNALTDIAKRDHNAFCSEMSGLVTRAHLEVINAKVVSQEAKLAYAIVSRLNAIIDNPGNGAALVSKLQYLATIVNLVNGIVTPDECMTNPVDGVVRNDILTNACNIILDYYDAVDDDNDILRLFKQNVQSPYYGQIPIES